MLRTVAMLLLPPVAPFEAGTITEVFGLDRTDDGLQSFDFRVCGPVAGEPLTTTVGMTMTPEYGLEGLVGADLVAISATRARVFDDAVLDAVRAAYAAGATMLTICSGAFVLAAAGLLDDRRATMHWTHVEEFGAAYPKVCIDPDVLFVDEGDIITGAGTAAGIDACLHLVRRELGNAAANIIARRMVVPPQREGGQRQFIEQPIPRCTDDGLAPILEHVLDHLGEEHSVADLALRARMSERTFARRFLAETGTTPHRWLTLQRVLHAQRLLEETSLGIDAVAGRCGFGSGTLLRHHFRNVLGVSPAEFRRTFQAGPALVSGA
jgi:AraC family transcriptional regulator, transcriptional activator FtrA